MPDARRSHPAVSAFAADDEGVRRSPPGEVTDVLQCGSKHLGDRIGLVGHDGDGEEHLEIALLLVEVA